MARSRVSSPFPLLTPATASACTEDLGPDRQEWQERRFYDLTERVLELDLRLRERVEAERVMDAEVRSLQRDAELRHFYVADLEQRHTTVIEAHTGLVAHVGNLEGQATALASELDVARGHLDRVQADQLAMEARAVVRIADALASRAAAR
jgi:hypothetical protein